MDLVPGTAKFPLDIASAVSDEMRRVSGVILRIRREKGLTWRQIGDQLDWTPRHTSNIASLRNPLSLVNALAILHVMGVSPSEFWARLAGSGPDDVAARVAKLEEAMATQEQASGASRAELLKTLVDALLDEEA